MLRRYIKEHRQVICAFVLMLIIFFASFYLYRLPLKAVVYPSVICLFICLVFFLCGYLRFAAKHRRLSEIQVASATLIGRLPEAETVDDEDYRRIIENESAKAGVQSGQDLLALRDRLKQKKGYGG